MRSFKYIFLLCLSLAAGCVREDTVWEAETKEILLSIEGIAPGNTAETVAGTPGKTVRAVTGAPDKAVGAVAGAPGNATEAGTRAAVDEWKNTTVSIADAVESAVSAADPVFDKALTVNITDNDNGKYIHTGIAYPSDGITPASVIGYHPAKTPNGQGIVSYDISGGDLDIMLSNKLTGTQGVPIVPATTPMKFEHQLTRFTFIMKCAPSQSYPETVHGLRATASAPLVKKLMTYTSIDLNNGVVNFSVPGPVTSGFLEGAVVPQSGDPDLIFEIMLQPEVPVTFEVVTLTDVKQPIIPTSGTNSLWNSLLSNGGEAGKQYTVRLEFSGENILVNQITIESWDMTVVTAATGGTWW
jgi:hypothetical protein